MINVLPAAGLVHAVDTDGASLAFLGSLVLMALLTGLFIAREVAARRRTEVAFRESDVCLREIEARAPLGLAVIRPNGSFTRVNPALCALTGYRRDELLTMTIVDIAHPDDRAGALSRMQSLVDGEARGRTETRYVRKDGGCGLMALSGSAVRDDAGEVRYVIAHMLDITDRHITQQELLASRDAASAGTVTKARFLAAMSHEIRTPMNGIIGMTELLSLSVLDSEQRECVNVVQESSRLLLRVIDDILDYSRLESGKVTTESVEFDVRALLRSAVSLLEPQFERKGVAIATHVEPNVPIVLGSDPQRLRQILGSLLDNALKFTAAGGSVTVRLAHEVSDAGAGALRLTVTDTGDGIAPELQGRLFEPFSQIDTSSARKYGGTGLGLSICKQLVELLGGSIGIDSSSGSGSSFWFSVPVGTVAAAGALPENRPFVPNRRPATQRPRIEKLLLAEDNEINALLARQQFERLGFRVTAVADGLAAVAAVEAEHFDIVFMDCRMPDMDGLDATREIRRRATRSRRHLPIVALTANALAEDREACLAAGMDDFVSKPAALSVLGAVLERWLPAHG